MPEQAGGVLIWAGALLAGGLLGAGFFAGLWWTVRRAALSPTPAWWFLCSLIVRTSVVLAGLYAVGAGQPVQMGLYLLGFLLARAIVLRATKPVSDAVAPTSGVPPCA